MVHPMLVLIAIIGLALLQLVVYWKLRDRTGNGLLDAQSGEFPAVAEDSSWDATGRRADDSAGARRCPACGTPNDPAYTFCRECVGRIGV